MKWIKFLSVILICFCGTVKADPPSHKKVDSLKVILSKTKKPIHRIDLLNALSRLEKDRGNRAIALDYAKSAITAASKGLNYNKGKIDALLNLGNTERELGNYDVALSYLEELIKISNQSRDINAKGNAYDNIGHIFLAKNNKELALKYHLLALTLRKESKDYEGCANSYNNIGDIYASQNNYLLAAYYYKQSLAIFEKLKDNYQIAHSAANVGFMLQNIGNYSEALGYNNIALEKYEGMGNKEGIIWMNRTMGEIYSKTDKHSKALEYFQKSLEMSEELKSNENIAESYSSIGNYYSEHKKNNDALKYYFKYLDLGKKNNESTILTRANYQIGKVKWQQNKWEEALHYLETSYNLADKTSSNDAFKFASLGLIGQIYLKQGNYKTAKEYIEKSLEYHKATAEKGHLATDYKNLSEINEKLGDYENGLKNYKLYRIYQDSVNKDDISKTIMKYEFDKKEKLSKIQQQKEISRKNLISNTIYGILGTTIMLIGFTLYTLRIRNKKLAAEKQNLELKNRETQLAKETEEFKARFLSNISHEFRTPLTLINGHLEILKKDANTKYKNRFDEMEYSGRRLLQLINQLLDLTKLQKNKYTLFFKKGNLLNEVQNYIQAFYSMAESKNIHLQTEITETAKAKFSQIDFAYSSETLSSIINNLISNAIKFTPNFGNIQSIIDFKKNQLYLSVFNTGEGIPEKDLPYIFDRFYQVETKEKPIYEGSGIGLSIVKELALLHGGDVMVENKVNEGCTFMVWLSEGQSISEAEVPSLSISAITLNDYNPKIEFDNEEKPLILVVEDQRELRKFIVENLGNEFRYLEAENGKQGVEIALDQLPDMIISDVMMPEMNGFQLCKTLKENEITSHIPIILLTAKSEHTDKIEGLETGADDYLTKPFSISELILRIKNRVRQLENLRRKFSGNVIPTADELPEMNERDRNFLEKLGKLVRENIEKEFSVIDLSSEIGLSSSQLTRKLKALIGLTPANFIKNIQMEIALSLLKNGDSVSETAWRIGFSEPAYFSKVFKKHFGFLPSEKDKF